VERQRLKRKKRKVFLNNFSYFHIFWLDFLYRKLWKNSANISEEQKNKVSRLTSVIFGKFNQRGLRYKLHIESFLQLEKFTQYCSI